MNEINVRCHKILSLHTSITTTNAFDNTVLIRAAFIHSIESNVTLIAAKAHRHKPGLHFGINVRFWIISTNERNGLRKTLKNRNESTIILISLKKYFILMFLHHLSGEIRTIDVHKLPIDGAMCQFQSIGLENVT